MVLGTYFGTATSRVSKYSESSIKFSLETTSASDRTERFPLNAEFSGRRCQSEHTVRLLAPHLDKRALGNVIVVKLTLHDVVYGVHFLPRQALSGPQKCTNRRELCLSAPCSERRSSHAAHAAHRSDLHSISSLGADKHRLIARSLECAARVWQDRCSVDYAKYPLF